MKIKFNTKYNTIAFYCVLVFAICILLVLLAFRLEQFIAVARSILSALSPVIWGFAVAYLLSPIVNKTEHFLHKYIFRKKGSKPDQAINKLIKVKQEFSIKSPEEKEKNDLNDSEMLHPRLCRSISILVAMLISISAITALIVMAVPEIANSIAALMNNMQDYLNSLYNTIVGFFNHNLEISNNLTDWFEDQFENVEKTILGWLTDMRPTFDKYVTFLKDGVFNFVVGVKDFALGFIVSVYLLYSKERFLRQFSDFFEAILPKNLFDVLAVKGAHANKIFKDFIVGKAVDSIIIGMLTFTTLVIFGIPNSMLISFLIAITNMIPFFGPFIGAIPSALLVLLTSPKKTVAFIIIVLVIQQFDGNILGPKILGNKLNLPTFWIMFSIFFFGNLFGFIGMLVGVPVFAVIYTLTKEFVVDRLTIKRGNVQPTKTDDSVPEPPVFIEDDN